MGRLVRHSVGVQEGGGTCRAAGPATVNADKKTKRPPLQGGSSCGHVPGVKSQAESHCPFGADASRL
jgi:hypothetical protein